MTPHRDAIDAILRIARFSFASTQGMAMSQQEVFDRLLESAYEAFEAEDIEQARDLWEQARAMEPDAREIWLLDIDLLELEGDAEEAVARAESALRAYPNDLILSVRFATLLLDVYEDVGEARPHLEDAWRRIRAGERPEISDEGDTDEIAVDFELELLLTLSDCRAADLDPRGALEAAEAAIALDRSDAMARLAWGAALFDLWRFEEAEKAVGQALDREPRLADAYWLRGRIATARGDEGAAERSFQRAISIDPDRFSAPHRCSEDEFVAIMEEALEELPEPVQDYLKNVAISVEDTPPAERLQESDPPLSPGSLGLFEGQPPALAPSEDPWAHFPKQITLFRKNIEISAATSEDLRDLIGTTLLHEVGHFLGLDEADLEERGLA